MRKSRPVADRFWEKVGRMPADGCWLWTAGVRHGYGWFAVQSGVNVGAHRWSYERAFGPITGGGWVLHKRHCTSRRCVNPAHLYLGTPKENSADAVAMGTYAQTRKTHCKRGHPLSGDNLYPNRLPVRSCITCQHARAAAWKAAWKARR